jgi:hypothetical protein
MGLIHLTCISVDVKVIRSPEILAKKVDFIRRNKKLFDFVMVKDYDWRHLRKWGNSNWGTKSRMASVDESCYGPHGFMLADQIRKVFGYNEATSSITILFTFRKLYEKIYGNDRKTVR